VNYSKGISWFDDCRIPFVDENIDFNTILKQSEKNGTYKGRLFETEIEKKHYKPEGRFPANLLVSDDMLNDGSVGGIHKNYIHSGGSIEQKIYGGGKGIPLKANRNIVSDKGSNSRYYDIDVWFDNLLENYIY